MDRSVPSWSLGRLSWLNPGAGRLRGYRYWKLASSSDELAKRLTVSWKRSAAYARSSRTLNEGAGSRPYGKGPCLHVFRSALPIGCNGAGFLQRNGCAHFYYEQKRGKLGNTFWGMHVDKSFGLEPESTAILQADSGGLSHSFIDPKSSRPLRKIS